MKKLAAALLVLSICLPAHASTPAVQWGLYIVRTHVDVHASATGYRASIDILRDGRVVKAIVGNGSPHVAIRGPLLLASVGDLGNDGLDLVYGFRLTRAGIENVIATPGVLGAFTLDGKLLHVRDYAAFNEFDHFSRATIGPVERVYRWKRGRYVDATAAHPEAALDRAAAARRRFLRDLPAIEEYAAGGDLLTRGREDVMAPVVEFWANEAVAGQRLAAERFLLAYASPPLRRWIDGHRRQVYAALTPRSRIMPADNRPVIGSSL